MEQLWQHLHELFGFRPDRAHFEHLSKRYGERHRVYHTLAHVEDCLSRLDEFTRSVSHSTVRTIALAIWYHDAYCQPGKRTNEERSAELTRVDLRQIGYDGDLADEVARLVEATNHRQVPRDEAARILVDVDLAVLGEVPEVYAAYQEGIRKEYSVYPARLYRQGRQRFLRQMLARNRIFQTEHGLKTYERRARENLLAELSLHSLQPSD